MLNREELYDQWCVADLIQVVEQVPSRLAARSPIEFSEPVAAMLLLWSVLRWERTFLIACLEALGTDMWALTTDVDELLKERQTRAARGELPTGPVAVAPRPHGTLDHSLRVWLARAGDEARLLGHRYLGTEHLLLAILARPGEGLAQLLTRHGLHYGRVKAAVLSALQPSVPQAAISPPQAAAADGLPCASAAVPLVAELVPEGPPLPHGAVDAGEQGVGVPRRFGMAGLMALVTLFALLCSILRVFGAPPEAFVCVAVLAAAVGLGQALLFGGRWPRAASLLVGTGLVPAEVLVLTLDGRLLSFGPSDTLATRLLPAVVLSLLTIPVGAVAGYVAGTLVAGSFFLTERRQRTATQVGKQ